MIPYKIIEDIKNRCAIEDVISSYVTLKRGGSTLKGLCPFHSERTPSFTVFPSSQNFYCFGCGAGGDVVSFIMRVENLDYPSALRYLADKVGITIPEENGGREEQGVTRKRILEMNKAAARFFRDMLFDERVGVPAREYFVSRGLTSATVKRFGLGYSPGGNLLRKHLRELGFSYDEMLAGYICGRSRDGNSYYDYFRGRVMFPIIDVTGNVVAFGGRVLDDSLPKYLNSSDTPAFKKSRTLFALNYAKANCAERLILCEGYMDVIALHAAGFGNAVATLGTAITPEHARLMKKYTPEVVIAYDSDEAGQRAADKAFRLLGEVGMNARILKMEGAKDPDEFIKKFGAAAFKRIVEESRSQFDYKLENLQRKYDLANTEDKIKASAEICGFIASVYSSVERDIYISKTAKAFELERESVERDVKGIIRQRNKKEKSETFTELIRSTAGYSDRVNRDFAASPKNARLEEIVLGLLLLHNEYISVKLDGNAVDRTDFSTEFAIRVFDFFKRCCDSDGFDIGMLAEEFTPDEVSRAVRLLTDRQRLSDNGERVYLSALKALRAETRLNSGGEDELTALINSKKNKQ